MSDVIINKQTYRIGKLNAKLQFRLSRKLLPILASVVPLLKTKMGSAMLAGMKSDDKAGAALGLALSDFDSFEMIEPVMTALSSMPDADVDAILDTALSAVQRLQNNHYAPVWEPRSQSLMFEDIELPQMLMLTLEVIKVNLAPFMSALPQGSPPDPLRQNGQ